MTPLHWVVTMLTATALIYVVAAGAYQFSGRPGMMTQIRPPSGAAANSTPPLSRVSKIMRLPKGQSLTRCLLLVAFLAALALAGQAHGAGTSAAGAKNNGGLFQAAPT